MMFDTADAALAAIQAHPACASYVDDGKRYVVYYPAKFVIPGGVLQQNTGNPLVDLNALYDKIDKFWSSQA